MVRNADDDRAGSSIFRWRAHLDLLGRQEVSFLRLSQGDPRSDTDTCRHNIFREEPRYTFLQSVKEVVIYPFNIGPFIRHELLQEHLILDVVQLPFSGTVLPFASVPYFSENLYPINLDSAGYSTEDFPAGRCSTRGGPIPVEG